MGKEDRLELFRLATEDAVALLRRLDSELLDELGEDDVFDRDYLRACEALDGAGVFLRRSLDDGELR